jgi:hypothetical protein
MSIKPRDTRDLVERISRLEGYFITFLIALVTRLGHIVIALTLTSR